MTARLKSCPKTFSELRSPNSRGRLFPHESFFPHKSGASFAYLDRRVGRPNSNSLAPTFLAAVYVEEERGQAYEKQRAAEHPKLIGPQGRNLLRREKYERNAEDRSKQAAGSSEEHRHTAVLASRST